MASNVESGISTYVGHFQLLIDVCKGFGDAYYPQNTALKTAAMEVQITEIQTAIDNVDLLLPIWLTNISIRHSKFDPIIPLAARIQAEATVLDLPEAILHRIREVVRKMRGVRSHKLTDKNKFKPNGDPVKHISVSQTSFNEQFEHFNQLIDLVASQPEYAPVEHELTVESLTALLGEMKTSNHDVLISLAPLAAARQERDRLLYAPKTGMMDTALLVKEYVKAVFGASSPQYKEVRHITFRNR